MIWQNFREKNLNFCAPRTVTGTPVGLMVFCHKVGAIDFLALFSVPQRPQNYSEYFETKIFRFDKFYAKLLQKVDFHFYELFCSKFL